MGCISEVNQQFPPNRIQYHNHPCGFDSSDCCTAIRIISFVSSHPVNVCIAKPITNRIGSINLLLTRDGHMVLGPHASGISADLLQRMRNDAKPVATDDGSVPRIWGNIFNQEKPLAGRSPVPLPALPPHEIWKSQFRIETHNHPLCSSKDQLVRGTPRMTGFRASGVPRGFFILTPNPRPSPPLIL